MCHLYLSRGINVARPIVSFPGPHEARRDTEDTSNFALEKRVRILVRVLYSASEKGPYGKEMRTGVYVNDAVNRILCSVDYSAGLGDARVATCY